MFTMKNRDPFGDIFGALIIGVVIVFLFLIWKSTL